jgi:hypothetical protein
MIIAGAAPASAERFFLTNGEMIEGDVMGTNNTMTIIIQKNGRAKKIPSSQILRVEPDIIIEEPETTEISTTESDQIYDGAELQEEDSEVDLTNPRFAGMTTHDLVLELLQKNGMKDGMKQNAKNILNQIPENKRGEIQALINVDELIEAIVPIYEKNFSVKELQELILFYEGDLGKKLIKVTPQISLEAAEAATVYFQQKLKK